MSATREKVLHRIQEALRNARTAGVQADGAHAGETLTQRFTAAIDRSYQRRDTRDQEAIIQEFVERVREYKATVSRVGNSDLPAKIAETLAGRKVQRLVVPADFPTEWLPTDLTILCDAGDLSYEELDASNGVLTGCAIGIAQTGTIVMDHSVRQGRRAISLVPDYHLCIVREEQVVGVVSEGIDGLTPAIRAGRPITFISGPSATSDIELNRVEGVHGPRTLDVLVVG